MKIMEITVKGRVQGVGFRYFTVQIAQRLGIRGTVQNCPNGDVMVRCCSDNNNLHEFLDFLRIGPQGSRVDDLIIASYDYEKDYSGFHVLY